MDDNDPVEANKFPGDFVMAASKPEQFGIVTAADLIVDLLTIDNISIKGIQSKCLKRIHDFKPGDFVVCNGTLGFIMRVCVSVAVELDDGTEHRVVNPKQTDLGSVEELKVEAPLQYYIGQRVQRRDKAGWVKGTVTEVTVVPEINWFASADKETYIPNSSPKPTEDLKLLSAGAHLSWKVGDLCLLPSTYPTVAEPSDEMATKVLIISNIRTTVDVCWQNGVVEQALDATSLDLVEIVGEHDFYPEQYVMHVDHGKFGIMKAVRDDCTARVKWLQPSCEEEVLSVYMLERHPNCKFSYGVLVIKRPNQTDFEPGEWVGTITDMEDGKIVVTWTNGSKSKVVPEAIWRVYPPLDDDENDDDENGDDIDDEVINMTKDLVVCAGEEQENAVTLFSILSVSEEHTFLSQYMKVSANWMKKVQEEWKILRDNLPDGIYVRAYENRMDLLRAAMLGAQGTPYQDGVFVFDFQFPTNYPEVPPSTRFLSQGLSINPNLYKNGHICLSLLNTWEGEETEKWDTSKSSVLQLLVSLRSLVLNSRPYFNEAGYDELVGMDKWEKRSLSYNEYAFISNCKMMIRLMQKPPKDFEEMIVDHFKRRGALILKACKLYKGGALVGSLTEDASSSTAPTGDSSANSDGFVMALDEVLPYLKLALRNVGAEL